MHKVIGIDLGTTYSAAAAYDRDQMTSSLLPDDENPAGITPSVVSLKGGKAVVGWLAKRNAPADPRNTIVEIKREMGELFKPSTLEKYNARMNYKEGDPVRVLFSGDWMLPQQISALILMKMKSIAERKLADEIRDAVITVPAYFTSNQKKATEDAALLAGLYPRQLIPEPTAAAICYGLDKMEAESKVYLVYDLGGGTFDVSIIRVREGDVQVVATSGDRRLGGGDFDDAIAHWALEESKKAGLDVTTNPIARAMVKFAAEDTKKLLSVGTSAKIVVMDPVSGRSLALELDRATFEKLIDDLLKRSLNSVATALQYAEERKVPRAAIDQVLLVGGSTRVPKVRQILLDYFNRDEAFVRTDGNPDLLVARGAALVANRFDASPVPFDIRRKPSATLVNPDAEDMMKLTLITEHSLGVGVQDDHFDPIITRGRSIPVTGKKMYTNPEGATHVIAPVYQGEGTYVQENTLIGEMKLGPMQPLPAHQHQFEVTFALDENGLLTVTVNHQNENKTYTADFRHKTTVGGDDALITLREQLLALFESTVVTEIVPPPPPPVPSTAPGAASSAAAVAAAAVAYAGTSSPATTSAQTASDDGLPTGLLMTITAEVKEEYKSILRRSRKQLLRKIDPALVEAYNAFSRAANEGGLPEKLQDLADDLADAYDDARRTS